MNQIIGSCWVRYSNRTCAQQYYSVPKQIKLAMQLTMQFICVPPQSTVLSSPNFDRFVKRKQAASVAPESHNRNHLFEITNESTRLASKSPDITESCCKHPSPTRNIWYLTKWSAFEFNSDDFRKNSWERFFPPRWREERPNRKFFVQNWMRFHERSKNTKVSCDIRYPQLSIVSLLQWSLKYESIVMTGKIKWITQHTTQMK